MAEHQHRARVTYNAAADHYDSPANGYWERFGRRTVRRLQLKPGSEVLDVACGAGAATVPVAEVVGSKGRVVAVDLAEELLALAREKTLRRDLRHVDFRHDDMTSLDLPDECFDAVLCVFGVFFVSDMEALTAELWRMVRPGGRLAITTWGPDLFEPMYSAFDGAVGEVRPDLVSEFRPWDRLTDVAAVEELLAGVGAAEVEVEAEAGEQVLGEPESWWHVVLGSGLRSVVEAMVPEQVDTVRRRNLRFVRERGVTSIATNVIYGSATK